MTAATSAPATGSSLWRLRAWRYAFPAAVVNRAGDLLFDVTVVLWIGAGIGSGRSWAPAAVSGVLVAAALSTLVIGPLSGAVVDRTDGQRVIQRSNVIQLCAMGSLVLPASGIATPSTPALLTWIYLTVLVTNAAGQFYNQARTVMIATTIPSRDHVRAFSTQGGANSVVSIVAPAAAAPLYFSVGPAAALALNAFTFLASGALHSRITWRRHVSTIASQSFWPAFRDGVVAVTANRVLRTLILLITITALGSGMVGVLELFFLTDVLDRPASNLGWMNAAFAIGTIAGLTAAPLLADRIGPSRVLTAGIGLSGVLVALYAINTSLPAAVALYIAIAVPLGVVNVVIAPLAISAVPNDLLGRAMAAVNVLPAVASLVAMSAAGWLASGPMLGLDLQAGPIRLGPVNTLFLVCGLLFIGAALLTARTLHRAVAASAASHGHQSMHCTLEVDMPATDADHDEKRWRAYTHPVRVAILQLLDDRRPRRVTDIAAAIDAPVNSTSFHLRTLAKYGLIEPSGDSPENKDGRTSTWRRSEVPVTIPDLGADSPALTVASGVAREYEQAVLTRTSTWFSQATDPQSQSQTFNFDQTFHLTDGQLEQFRSRLRELLEATAATSEPTTGRPVHVWGFGIAAPPS